MSTSPPDRVQEEAPPARSLTSQMFDTAIASAAFMVLTFVAGVLLSRLLGPEGRGEYGAIQFWAQLGIGLLSFSVFDAAIVRLRKTKQRPETKLPSLFVLALAALVIYVAVSAAAATTGLVAIEGLDPLSFVWVSALIVLMGLSTRAFTSVESVNLDFRRLNIERIVTPIVFMIGIAVLFAVGEASPFIAALLFVAASVPVLLWRVVRFRNQLGAPVDGALVKDCAKTGLRLHSATGSFALAREADRLLLIAIWPAQWLGFYFVAYAAAGASVSLATQSLRVTLLPTLAGIDPEVRRDRVERLLRLTGLIAVGATAALWVVAPFIVPFVYGEAFAPASLYLQGLALPVALMPMMSIINITNRSMERAMPSVVMALAIIGAFAAGYAMTGYTAPTEVFVALTIGNLLAAAIGLAILRALGVVRLRHSLLPKIADFEFLMSGLLRYVSRRR